MKVIIADDDATIRLVLTTLIQKMGYEVITVNDGISAWEAYLEQTGPCIMLVDWEMPSLDGLELSKRIKDHAELNPPYIILVTSRIESADVVRGLELGADDYVRKPFVAAELSARVKVAERTLELTRKLNEAQHKLTYQANHDGLTGVLNRRALLEALETEIVRAQRLGLNLHLAMCDLDHFKKINDTYGHIKGDEVLKGVAQCMKRVFRGYDLVGRYGGEEFVIAMTGFEGEAVDAFERLRSEVEALRFETDLIADADSHRKVCPTISIGLSSCSPESLSGNSLEALLKQADERLYRAKVEGRNRVVFEDAPHKPEPEQG